MDKFFKNTLRLLYFSVHLKKMKAKGLFSHKNIVYVMGQKILLNSAISILIRGNAPWENLNKNSANSNSVFC